jgi:hypothetical protein
MNTIATFFASIIALFSGLLGHTSPPTVIQQPVSNIVAISATTSTQQSLKIDENNVSTSSSSQSNEALIWSDEKNKYTSSNGTIYINGVQIKDADQKSFQIITQAPFRSGPQADPSSGIAHYSKDQNNVYYDGKVIQNADEKSFVVVWSDKVGIGSEQIYAQDIHNAYYKGETLVPKADVASFNPLGEMYSCWRVDGNYSMDKSHIYYKNTEVIGADVSTFNSEYEGQYATDKSHVFLEGKIVPNADPATFKFPICDGEG